MSHDVFISYSKENRILADKICNSLESAGILCWMAPRDITPGKKYSQSIVKAIEECLAVVVIFSTKAQQSPHVCGEIERSFAKNKRIITLRVEDIQLDDNLEYFLSSVQWIDAFGRNSQDYIPLLIKAVRQEAEQKGVSDSNFSLVEGSASGKPVVKGPRLWSYLSIVALLLIFISYFAYPEYLKKGVNTLQAFTVQATDNSSDAILVQDETEKESVAIAQVAAVPDDIVTELVQVENNNIEILLPEALSPDDSKVIQARKEEQIFEESIAIKAVEQNTLLVEEFNSECEKFILELGKMDFSQRQREQNRDKLKEMKGKCQGLMVDFSGEEFLEIRLSVDRQISTIDNLLNNISELKSFSNGVGMEMVRIPRGSFLCGTKSDDAHLMENEFPPHKVKLESDYFIGAYEVTQSQWSKVMGDSKDGLLPVVNISWEDAVEFCDKLSTREGHTYSLPTEAEWEYACRATSETSFNNGHDGTDGLQDYCWCSVDFADSPRKCGLGQPNKWGLYDMHGNVAEWCQDKFGKYSSEDAVNPVGPKSGSERVVRGGSWCDFPLHCRSAFRDKYSAVSSKSTIGFRVVIRDMK